MTRHEAEVARLHSSGAMGVNLEAKPYPTLPYPTIPNFVADSVRTKSALTHS